ncbi:MAG TPA: glycosyltransferase family 4 protein [Lacipirellulaceae bacterium]|nr:glycosyltransferase family 4 protein [Lacipirellulaceae bacterium]
MWRGPLMSSGNETRRNARPRLLVTAYNYDRAYSMESRLSFQRARLAAQQYDVTVICEKGEGPQQRSQTPGVQTIELPATRWERALMSWTATYYLGYRRWHQRVYATARRLHSQQPFDLVHHVSFCGYREPSDCWQLPAPFVWGPVGGTRPFPMAFVAQLDLRGAAREVTRNVVNALQIRFDRRVRRAVGAAAAIMSANREVAGDLERHFGAPSTVQLETGVGQVRAAPRPQRAADQPLRILWSGRLRSWKGFPLLLRALAQLPPDCRYEVRVLGQGPCRERWARLAHRLGVARHIEWAGWPDYAGQLPHYDWADVFAFTSLRDTSGTGLLEALAAGAPIIGLDHQGAADIMSADCAIPISAKSAAAAIAGFRDAVARLAADRQELSRLSDGALARARQFQWDRQAETINAVYERAMARCAAAPLFRSASEGDASAPRAEERRSGDRPAACAAAPTGQAFC